MDVMLARFWTPSSRIGGGVDCSSSLGILARVILESVGFGVVINGVLKVLFWSTSTKLYSRNTNSAFF
jgi:hypothetical protein